MHQIDLSLMHERLIAQASAYAMLIEIIVDIAADKREFKSAS
jgi:hypothetical protein